MRTCVGEQSGGHRDVRPPTGGLRGPDIHDGEVIAQALGALCVLRRVTGRAGATYRGGQSARRRHPKCINEPAAPGSGQSFGGPSSAPCVHARMHWQARLRSLSWLGYTIHMSCHDCILQSQCHTSALASVRGACPPSSGAVPRERDTQSCPTHWDCPGCLETNSLPLPCPAASATTTPAVDESKMLLLMVLTSQLHSAICESRAHSVRAASLADGSGRGLGPSSAAASRGMFSLMILRNNYHSTTDHALPHCPKIDPVLTNCAKPGAMNSSVGSSVQTVQAPRAQIR